MPLYNNQFDGYALLQCDTQKTGIGLISTRALDHSTGKLVSYNAWHTIVGPDEENDCAFNLEMFNKMIRCCFRELCSASRYAYPTPNPSFDFIRRRYAQFSIQNANVFAINHN